MAIGGGHGLANTLAAARRYAGILSAVVSVADDGGSTGRLRRAMPIPAPGDIRKCLVALAGGSPGHQAWADALEYRFEAGELEGHALGNLLISGLAASRGDFLWAVSEAASLVGAVGRVLPATLAPVRLAGSGPKGSQVGQAAIAASGEVASVALLPEGPEAPAEAVAAIAEADQIVIGPGSLYTSVLAALAVPDIGRAVAAAAAQVVYVANLRQQIPETAGYSVADHVDALFAHGIKPAVVLCDSREIPLGTLSLPFEDVALSDAPGGGHQPARLAAALLNLLP